MKKLLIALSALTAAVCTASAFGACSTDKNVDDKEDGAYYGVTVTGIDDLFCEPLKDKYEAGTEVEVKLNVITDVSLYVYVNEIHVEQSHYDSDYWGYKFTMPGEDIVIYITSDAYHGVEICDFDKVFYWAADLTPEKTVKIKCESHFGCSQLPEITYTTDKADIENICEIFNCKLKPGANPQITGGYYITFTFYTADGNQYELPISSGYAVSISFSTSDYFKIIDFKMPQINNPSVN